MARHIIWWAAHKIVRPYERIPADMSTKTGPIEVDARGIAHSCRYIVVLLSKPRLFQIRFSFGLWRTELKSTGCAALSKQLFLLPWPLNIGIKANSLPDLARMDCKLSDIALGNIGRPTYHFCKFQTFGNVKIPAGFAYGQTIHKLFDVFMHW